MNQRKHLTKLSSVLAVLCLFFSMSANAYKIKNCSDDAVSNLSAAANFIQKNMSAITDQYTFLTIKQRQEIVRKWPNMVLSCRDNSSKCRGNSNQYGYSHGGPGSKIKLCYSNMVDLKYSTCDAVESIMHESGHAHGFRSAVGHNDPKKYQFNNDPIYRMGNLAQDYCELKADEGELINAPFVGIVRTALGGTCSKNSACASGKCESSKCVCNDDSDCPGKQSCYTPIGKANYCSSTTLALGASCSKNSQCESDKCESKVCVCKNNSDCAPGEACFTPVTKKNYCESTSKPLGASCSKNSQCSSDKCEKGECVCTKNTDCPGSQKCKTPVTKKNYCKS